MISQAFGRACKSVSRTKRGKGRKLSGIAGLMAMFARSFFCATGNSVPRFPRHGREAGKIACLGSMILGEKRGRCEREMKREKAKKRRRKKGRGWNDAQSFVHKGSSGEHNLQSVQKYFYYPLEINRKMRFLAKFANYISISMQVWYSENYKILINRLRFYNIYDSHHFGNSI